MANPVVHFEIISKDAKKAQAFYEALFGWKPNADNPMNYGIVDNGGEGINGGIGEADDGRTWATFYVAVPDPQATLDQAVSMGATVVRPVETIPGMVTLAMFSDPDGNLVGLVAEEQPGG